MTNSNEITNKATNETINENTNENTNETSTERVYVGKLEEFKSQSATIKSKGFFGKCVQVNLKERTIPVLVLLCKDDKFYAIDNRCPHMGYPLHVGRVVDIEDFGVCFGQAIKCPAHFWTFSLDNGQCDRTAHQLKVFPVQIDEGEVYIQVNP